MSYCTVDDLIARYGEQELVELTGQGQGAIGIAKAQQAIADASALIDSYLGGRYDLPLSAVPQALTRISADIARYHLYDNIVPEVVQNNYDNALSFLKSVAKGEVRLGLSQDNQSPASDDAIEIQSGGSVWGRNDSKGFI